MKLDDDDSDDLETVAALNNRVLSSDDNLGQNEPVDQYVSEVKDTLN